MHLLLNKRAQTLRCIYRVVVVLRLPQVGALPVDSMAGAGWREGGEGMLGAAGRQSVRRASRTVLSQGRPYNTGLNTCMSLLKSSLVPVHLGQEREGKCMFTVVQRLETSAHIPLILY